MSRDLSDVYEAIRLAEKEGRTADREKLVAYLDSLPAEDSGADARELKSTLGGAAMGAGVGAFGVPLLRAGAKEAAKVSGGVPVTSAFQEAAPQRSAFERMIQGGIDPESGTTGRARNVAYNEMTHNIAERAKMQQQTMDQLAKKGVIDPRKLATAVDTGGYGATPSGVLARPEAIAAETKAMPMGQRVRQGMSQLPQKAAAFGSGIANYKLPIVGAVGPVAGRGLVGAGAGIQATDAYNRLAQDDYLGATIGGIGSLGSAAMLLPHPAAKVVGGAIGIGAESLNQYIDYLKQKAQQPPQQQQQPQQEQMPVPMKQGGLVYLADGGRSINLQKKKEKSPFSFSMNELRPMPGSDNSGMPLPPGVVARLQLEKELEKAKLRAGMSGLAMAVPGKQGVQTIPGSYDVGVNMPVGKGNLDVGAFRSMQPIPDKGYAQGVNVKYTMPFSEGGSTTPAWQRAEGKSPSGGLNAIGRASYKRETGGELKAPQPEGGSRKKSFCARMGGMKKKLTSSKTANDPDSRINKALRKWKC